MKGGERRKCHNILVCDDDREIVDAIEILSDPGGAIMCLKHMTACRAIQMLEREGDLQLLIIDVMMPKLDGIRATLKIRERAVFRSLFCLRNQRDVDKILGLNISSG